MTEAPDINPVMGFREWLMLLVLALIWGGSFFFVGVAVTALPPLTIVTLRVGLAALLLWVVIGVTGIPIPRARSTWLALLGMGVLNNVFPFTMLVWGQTHIDSGLAAILNATTPLFAVIFAGAMLSDERITPLKVSGVVVGLIGAVVVIGPDALRGLGADLLAQVACLGAGVFYALAGVFGRRFKRLGLHPVMTATGMVTGATLVLIPITLTVDKPWQLALPGLAVGGSILGLAVLSTAVANILYFRILASSGATNLMLVTFLIPVSAILLGWLVLGEHLASSEFAGMGIIGFGLLLIDGRLWPRRLRHNPTGPTGPSPAAAGD